VTTLVPLLRARHDARVARDSAFQYLLEDVAEADVQRQKEQISLNETRTPRRARPAGGEAEIACRQEPVSRTAKTLRQDDGLLASERGLSADLAEEKAQKKSRDVLLIESARILNDEISLLKANTRLAAQVLPATKAMATTQAH
jgi:carboxyl-terminal processing protease